MSEKMAEYPQCQLPALPAIAKNSSIPSKYKTHITLRLTSQFHSSEEEPLGERRESRQLHHKHPGEEDKSAERMKSIPVRIPHAHHRQRRTAVGLATCGGIQTCMWGGGATSMH